MFTFEDARASLKGHGSVLPKMTHYRGKFLSKYPWFASLVMRLELIERDDIPTAATDGVHLFFNQAFLDQQNDEQAFGLFAHECGHCVFGHCDPQRRSDRDAALWNIAADYVVNNMLIAEGFTLPDGGLSNPDYVGFSTEEVYRIISVDPKQQAMAQQMAIDVLPFPKDAKPGTASAAGGKPVPVDHQKLRDAWAKAAIQAAEARAAHAAGNTPGGLCEQVQTNMAPVADYRSLLAEYLSACVTDDITWAVPNRRYFPQDMYKLSTVGEGIRHLILGIDCSGSVYTEMLSKFVSQIAALLAAYPIERLDVYIVDTIIQAKYEHVELDDLPRIAQVTGRGGTDFECVFKDLKTQPMPDLMMFFTDFECSMPPSSRDAPYPVLWMVPQECLHHTRQNYDSRCGTLIPVQ